MHKNWITNTLLVEMWNGIASSENNLTISLKKLNMQLPYEPVVIGMTPEAALIKGWNLKQWELTFTYNFVQKCS